MNATTAYWVGVILATAFWLTFYVAIGAPA